MDIEERMQRSLDAAKKAVKEDPKPVEQDEVILAGGITRQHLEDALEILHKNRKGTASHLGVQD